MSLENRKSKMERSKKNPPYPYYLHEHNYITQKEEPMMPIIDGWQTFKITSKCEHCGAVVTNYVKRIYKGENYAKTNED